MGWIAKSSVQAVHDRLDAVTVAENYIRLEKRGGRYWGRCPFHAGGQEKTPSLKIDPDTKLYYCFGCNKGGTIIDFVMEMDKISFPEAIRDLARKFGVELVYEGDGAADNRDREAEISRREELFELYRRTAVTFSHFLTEKPEGKPALEYLVSRKISREMIDRFRLGYSCEDRSWLYNFLRGKGYSAEFLDNSGLFSAQYKGMAFFSDRIMFPIADKQGRIIAFGGRAMPGAVQSDGKEPPKYINTREIETYRKGQILFGMDLALPEIRRSKTVYIAEGYMDVIALHQAGVTNAVAPCGTAFTDEQAKLLRNWADSAVLVFDSDEAGQNASVKGIITCRKSGMVCSLAAPGRSSDGTELKDPAEILQKFGAETLKNAMKCAIIDVDYLVARGKALYDVSNPQGKSKAFALLFPFFDALELSTERDECMQLAADKMRADKDALLNDYEHWRRSGRVERKPDFEEAVELPVRMNRELFLLLVVSVNMNLYPEFRRSVDIREIEDPAAKELFIALEECFVSEENGIDALLSRINSVSLRNFIIRRGMTPEFKADSDNDPRIRKLMEDGITQVKKLEKLRRRRSEIGAELRLAERNSGDGTDSHELIAEKMKLDAEIRLLEGK